MKITHFRIIAEHKLPDGRVLSCEYTMTVIRDDPYPDEYDYSGPEYTLDGERIEQDDLPIELIEVAVSMYVETHRYKHREEVVYEEV